jgi:MFS family permease
MTVLGIAGAYLSSAPTAVVGDVSGGKPRGSMMSAYQMSADFGAIFGPVIAGYLLDQTGSFVEPFAMAAIGMALLTLTVLRMPETLKSTTVAS